MTISVFPHNGEHMELIPGLWSPAGFDVQVSDAVHDVSAVVVPDRRSGLLVASSVSVHQRPGGEPVSTLTLRSTIPVGKLVRECVPYLQSRVADPETGETISVSTPWVDDSDVDHAKEHGTDERTLRRVAHVYRLALLREGTPTKAVAAAFQLSHATAGRWVGKAREAGFLGPVIKQGKAGMRNEPGAHMKFGL